MNLQACGGCGKPVDLDGYHLTLLPSNYVFHSEKCLALWMIKTFRVIIVPGGSKCV